MISRWQRWICWNGKPLPPMPAAVETAFVPSTRRAYLDLQALDFAGGW